MGTTYQFDRQEFFSRVGHHCYQPISKCWEGMQDLKLMCTVKLLENNPHFETITEEIPRETSETNLIVNTSTE